MNRARFHVKKGDNVIVISGNHKGSTGKILQILAEKKRVLIEGVRMIKKHVRKSQNHPEGGIIELEGPIHVSNVKKIEVIEEVKRKSKQTTKKSK